MYSLVADKEGCQCFRNLGYCGFSSSVMHVSFKPSKRHLYSALLQLLRLLFSIELPSAFFELPSVQVLTFSSSCSPIFKQNFDTGNNTFGYSSVQNASERSQTVGVNRPTWASASEFGAQGYFSTVCMGGDRSEIRKS